MLYIDDEPFNVRDMTLAEAHDAAQRPGTPPASLKTWTLPDPSPDRRTGRHRHRARLRSRRRPPTPRARDPAGRYRHPAPDPVPRHRRRRDRPAVPLRARSGPGRRRHRHRDRPHAPAGDPARGITPARRTQKGAARRRGPPPAIACPSPTPPRTKSGPRSSPHHHGRCGCAAVRDHRHHRAALRQSDDANPRRPPWRLPDGGGPHPHPADLVSDLSSPTS